VVPGLVYSAYDRVRAYETVLDDAPIETLHQLRISFKGLRYTLEFIEEVLGDGKDMIIAEVKAMQDHLGDLNDADMAAQIIEDFLASWSKKQRKVTAEQRQSATPMQAYLTRQVEKREALIADFPAVWERFNRIEFRQTLAKTIAML
jgi:CHAD domain-containing protein